jgi:hypothetical protein
MGGPPHRCRVRREWLRRGRRSSLNDILRGRVMVLAAYYDDEDRAERYEHALRRNARTFDGSVERYGTLTLLWVRGHEGRLAEPTRDCLL